MGGAGGTLGSRMKLPRVGLVLVVALGCSGPYGQMDPSAEPDDPATVSSSAAQIDTSECLPEGAEVVAGADTGPSRECCRGLTRVGSFKGSILRLDKCDPANDGHTFCIRCGDGRCGVGENLCTCEADCHWP